METILRLLVVEDEALIAAMVEATLADDGYGVVTAGGATEAIAILDAKHTELSGLITDIRLGSDLDGWDVARRARELRPEMAVVYITGDSCGDWTSKGVPRSLILQKPFVPTQITTAISALLTGIDSQPDRLLS